MTTKELLEKFDESIFRLLPRPNEGVTRVTIEEANILETLTRAIHNLANAKEALRYSSRMQKHDEEQ